MTGVTSGHARLARRGANVASADIDALVRNDGASPRSGIHTLFSLTPEV